jgi:hypothetical protein
MVKSLTLAKDFLLGYFPVNRSALKMLCFVMIIEYPATKSKSKLQAKEVDRS